MFSSASISFHVIAQGTQILGALLCLTGFAAAQFRWSTTDSYLYLGLNLGGSTLLAALALYESQLGFLLLEACWALITLGALVKKLSSHKANQAQAVASKAQAVKDKSDVVNQREAELDPVVH